MTGQIRAEKRGGPLVLTTELTRRQHELVGGKYASDLTDAEWAVMAPLMVTTPLIPQFMQLDCFLRRLAPNSTEVIHPTC